MVIIIYCRLFIRNCDIMRSYVFGVTINNCNETEYCMVITGGTNNTKNHILHTLPTIYYVYISRHIKCIRRTLNRKGFDITYKPFDLKLDKLQSLIQQLKENCTLYELCEFSFENVYNIKGTNKKEEGKRDGNGITNIGL